MQQSLEKAIVQQSIAGEQMDQMIRNVVLSFKEEHPQGEVRGTALGLEFLDEGEVVTSILF